ncbi:MAG: hypothetical protein AAF805_11000 [Planctomycetota bacterium]
MTATPSEPLPVRGDAMQNELSMVRDGLISADDYVAAVERREAERAPLGQLAIESGLLSPRRVRELLREQHGAPGERFGELAMRRGDLDLGQVALLLLEQQERQRPLVDHLVELGRLDADAAASQPESAAGAMSAV